MECGGLCVMITGMSGKLQLFADNWDITSVSLFTSNKQILLFISVHAV